MHFIAIHWTALYTAAIIRCNNLSVIQYFKNIIVINVENYTTNEGGNRQALNNVGTGTGYYITNGKYIPIKCYKTSRSSQTVYKDLEGNEIKVNDGKTFIQICPINSKISFE